MRQVRQVTKSVNPQNHAVWTLDRLYQYLCQWAYEIYDTLVHSALSQSPREAYAAGMACSGQRLHRLIPYDADFRLHNEQRHGAGRSQPRSQDQQHLLLE